MPRIQFSTVITLNVDNADSQGEKSDPPTSKGEGWLKDKVGSQTDAGSQIMM
jgi:hypothetical protein